MFIQIVNKLGEPAMYLGTSADVSGSDSTINEALPNADAGTMICTAGYGTIKQKAADGSWVAL